jgi:hypothetical protein
VTKKVVGVFVRFSCAASMIIISETIYKYQILGVNIIDNAANKTMIDQPLKLYEVISRIS